MLDQEQIQDDIYKNLREASARASEQSDHVVGGNRLMLILLTLTALSDQDRKVLSSLIDVLSETGREADAIGFCEDLEHCKAILRTSQGLSDLV